MNVGMYSDGGEVSKFGSRPKYGTKPETKDNWFTSYIQRLTKSQEDAGKMIPSFMRMNGKADALGAGSVLRQLTGQGQAGDKFAAALFPLNFLGIGKIGKEGIQAGSPIIKKSSGILSKIFANISEARNWVHYAHKSPDELLPSIGRPTDAMHQYGPGTYGSTTGTF